MLTTYLCTGVVEITTSESSKIFCPCQFGGGDPVGIEYLWGAAMGGGGIQDIDDDSFNAD